MTLLNDIQLINQSYDNVETKFTVIKDYLISHNHERLYDQMTAPGIVEYQDAYNWFEDYFVLDENEGPDMAQDIKRQLDASKNNHADYYWGGGDYDFGYDWTPDSFDPVTEASLQEAIDELLQQLKDPDYTMYVG